MPAPQLTGVSQRVWSSRHKLLTWLLLLFVLSGCETTPQKVTVKDQPEDWVYRQQRLEGFDAWTLQGKLAYRQGSRHDSLVINQWQQRQDNFSIHVSSPLFGLGATTIEGSPAYIGLHQPDEPSLFSTEPELLLNEAFGWSLPLEQIPYWIKGLPFPGEDAELLFDQQGNPYRLTQAQWEVELDRFEPLDNMMLPRKITLTYGDIRLKVIVSSWQSL